MISEVISIDERKRPKSDEKSRRALIKEKATVVLVLVEVAPMVDALYTLK